MKHISVAQDDRKFRILMAMAERCEAVNLKGSKKGEVSINAFLRKIADGEVQCIYKNRTVSNKTILDR